MSCVKLFFDYVFSLSPFKCVVEICLPDSPKMQCDIEIAQLAKLKTVDLLPIDHSKLQRRSKYEECREESINSKSLAGPDINNFLNNFAHLKFSKQL
jgi:hypothetical protein